MKMTIICISLSSMVGFGTTGKRVILLGRGGWCSGSTGKPALSMASPPDLLSHKPDPLVGLQDCPSQPCSHQTKGPRSSFPPRAHSTPSPPVNQGHWWFSSCDMPWFWETCPPSHLNSFSGTGFPQAVLTLTQNPLSSRLRTLSVPGDADICLYTLPLWGITHFATFICFHCHWILTKPSEVSAIISQILQRRNPK